MVSLLIDDRGELRSANDSQLRKQLCTTLSGADLARYAIINLGWVDVRRNPRSIRIRCRPSVITEVTLAGLLMELWNDRSALYSLECFRDDWHATIFSDRAKLTRYLSAITGSQRDAATSTRRFLSRRRSLATSPFATSAMVAQRIATGLPNIASAKPVFDAVFSKRWSLYKLDNDNNQSRLVSVGAGYTPFNPQWRDCDAPLTTCDYGDPAFGSWVAASHRVVHESRTAVCDDIDAIVNFKRIGDVRLRYSRLLLDLDHPSDGRLILSAAVSNSAVNLRQHVS